MATNNQIETNTTHMVSGGSAGASVGATGTSELNTSQVHTELDQYEQFLLTEYNNIASAHFNIINTISSFFKNYLVIIAVPITAIGAINKLSSNIQVEFSSIVLLCLSILFYLVGTSILAHIVNLRLESLLYAKTVNGIRKYFADKHAHANLDYLVLPKTLDKPGFFEPVKFGPVVLIFCFVNTIFPIAGIWWYMKDNHIQFNFSLLQFSSALMCVSIIIYFILYILFVRSWSK